MCWLAYLAIRPLLRRWWFRFTPPSYNQSLTNNLAKVGFTEFFSPGLSPGLSHAIEYRFAATPGTCHQVAHQPHGALQRAELRARPQLLHVPSLPAGDGGRVPFHVHRRVRRDAHQQRGRYRLAFHLHEHRLVLRLRGPGRGLRRVVRGHRPLHLGGDEGRRALGAKTRWWGQGRRGGRLRGAAAGLYHVRDVHVPVGLWRRRAGGWRKCRGGRRGGRGSDGDLRRDCRCKRAVVGRGRTPEKRRRGGKNE